RSAPALTDETTLLSPPPRRYTERVREATREWRNWQTRKIQVLVSVRMWGFNSPLPQFRIAGVRPWKTAVQAGFPGFFCLMGSPSLRRRASFCLAVAWLSLATAFGPVTAQEKPPGQSAAAVTAPPESLFEKVRERDRDLARRFYKKYVDVKGLAVVASAGVADEALQRTHFLVTHLLAGRPDILAAMVKHGTRLIIIGKDQVYTDMPEYRDHPNPAYQN